MASRLLLIRHAEVAEEFQGKFLGSTDAPLSDRGRRQAAALADAGRSAEVRLVSPLQRARVTAELAGLDCTVEPNLAEIDFGRWECKTFDDIRADDPAAIDQWAEFDDAFTFPDGEGIGDFCRRINALADRLAAEPVETVLIVTHGGVIRTMLCHLLGLPAPKYVLFAPPYASVTELQLFDGKGVLVAMSDTPLRKEADHG